jgi:hypothetical protein
MVADWSPAQNTSISEQLNGGIRCLDLRIGRMPASDGRERLVKAAT